MDDELYRRFLARQPSMSAAQKKGRVRIDGLETTKYAFGDEGELKAAGFYWITDTGIMVRREYEDGVFGKNVKHKEYLTDLTISQQPASLFAIPAGYKKAR
jgi:hypothetical protein